MKAITILTSFLALIILFFLFGTMDASADPDDEDHCFVEADDFNSRGFIMATMMVGVVGAIVFFVFILLYQKEQGASEGHGFDPIRILDERYSRGEIPRREYLRMKEELKR